MTDRQLFRALLVASLTNVHRLPLAVAMAAFAEYPEDLFQSGLPVGDAAALLVRDRCGERRANPMGVA